MHPIAILAMGLVCAASSAAIASALLPHTRFGAAEAKIAAPRERIVNIIRDVARQPEWRSGVRSVEVLPDRRFIETTARGETITFTWVEEVGADLALHFTSSRGYRGQWTATLYEGHGATRVVVAERSYLDNLISKLIAHIFFDPADFSRQYLTDLRARAEGGA